MAGQKYNKAYFQAHVRAPRLYVCMQARQKNGLWQAPMLPYAGGTSNTDTTCMCAQVNAAYINAQNAWLQANLAASTATYNIVTVRVRP